jgi:hypothetical protein
MYYELSIHRATSTAVSMPGDGFDFCKVRSWGAARNSLCEGRRLGRTRVQYVDIRDRDGDDGVEDILLSRFGSAPRCILDDNRRLLIDGLNVGDAETKAWLEHQVIQSCRVRVGRWSMMVSSRAATVLDHDYHRIMTAKAATPEQWN